LIVSTFFVVMRLVTCTVATMELVCVITARKICQPSDAAAAQLDFFL
jgi:hypothetical protein